MSSKGIVVVSRIVDFALYRTQFTPMRKRNKIRVWWWDLPAHERKYLRAKWAIERPEFYRKRAEEMAGWGEIVYWQPLPGQVWLPYTDDGRCVEVPHFCGSWSRLWANISASVGGSARRVSGALYVHLWLRRHRARSGEDLRRAHVKAAIADSRIEGYPPPSRPEQAIFDAFIRGDIEAKDLVTAVKKQMLLSSQPS